MRTALSVIALIVGLLFVARGFLAEGVGPDPGVKERSMTDASAPKDPQTEDAAMDPNEKVALSEEAWRTRLTPEQYHVTREAGTERAFTGEYWDTKTAGTYKCRCCGLPLFTSDAKFDSGCGWPSFFEPLEGFHVTEHEDRAYGMRRVEVRCRKCDAHLGHVFPDGPEPTGLRYCINSASIDLDAAEEADEGAKPEKEE